MTREKTVETTREEDRYSQSSGEVQLSEDSRIELVDPDLRTESLRLASSGDNDELESRNGILCSNERLEGAGDRSGVGEEVSLVERLDCFGE